MESSCWFFCGSHSIKSLNIPDLNSGKCSALRSWLPNLPPQHTPGIWPYGEGLLAVRLTSHDKVNVDSLL